MHKTEEAMQLRYPPTDFKPLTIEGGGFVEFGDLFRRLRSRWVKVEFLQKYDETGFDAYSAYLNGDNALAASLVSRYVKGQQVYVHAREYDVEMVRIRVYQVPLSDYLVNYEFHAYVADVEMGEHIFAVDWERVSELIEQTGVSDFLIFDDWAVVALIYDEASGVVQEARLVSDAKEIAKYAVLSEKLLEAAEPLADSKFAAHVQEASR
jgi:hypothetical protein